jgi:HEAT repeat protein
LKNIRTLSGGLFCFLAVLGLSAVVGVAVLAQDEAETVDPLVTMIITFLQNEDKGIRAAGLEQIRTSAEGVTATEQFAALLPDLIPDAQIGLLNALSDRGDEAARPAILELLAASEDEAVRVAAIGAIDFLGSPEELPVVMTYLCEGSDAEKSAARQCLVRLRGETVPGLIVDEIQSNESVIKVALIEILAARRAFGTIPDILESAVSDNASVRVAAMVALGELGGPDDIAGMAQGVLKAESGREREAAEKAIMFVTARIEDPELRAESLLDAMRRMGQPDQETLLPTVGRIGGLEARRLIEAVIAAPEPLHGLGLRSLCNWPNASIAPRLLQLAESDPHADHQIAALRAVIRIAPLKDDRTNLERLNLLQQAMELCTRDSERTLVLDRAKAIRILETLHFVAPYMDEAAFSEQACRTVIELGHDRTLRTPNKSAFDVALEKVKATAEDPVLIERAQRYIEDKTWVQPLEE